MSAAHMMSLRFVCVCLALVLLAYCQSLINVRRFIAYARDARGIDEKTGWWDYMLPKFIPPPPNLSTKLLQIPELEVAEMHKQIWKQDGILHLKNVFTQDILSDLELRVPIRSGMEQQGVTRWMVNSAIRVLIRDGPLGAVAAALLDKPGVRLVTTNMFGGLEPLGASGWHADFRASEHKSTSGLTIWIALTDAPGAFQVAVNDMKQDHCLSGGIGFDDSCIQTAAGKYMHETGKDPLPIMNASAGDVLFFHGHLAHRTWNKTGYSQRRNWVIRVAASDEQHDCKRLQQNQNFAYFSYAPPYCSPLQQPLFPIIYPKHESQMNMVKFPLPALKEDGELEDIRKGLFSMGRWCKPCPDST